MAELFAGIFITIIPVLAMLKTGMGGVFAPLVALVQGPGGEPNNLAYFWITGGLSSFLDNAPTYLVFFELAGGDAQHLMTEGATTLAAISAGAVFMGANTYIGNAPNFMVYAMARDAGVKMPGFFGYMLWSGAILLPLFAVVGWVFFAGRRAVSRDHAGLSGTFLAAKITRTSPRMRRPGVRPRPTPLAFLVETISLSI